MADAQIDQHGDWEYMSSGTTRFKRRAGTVEWLESDTTPVESLCIELKIVRERQTPGEPDHWLLFLSPEGQPGTVYEVRGDAVAMHYNHTDDVDALISESFKDAYVIAQLSQQQIVRVRYWATHEVPPSAPNQAAVKEYCQGWVIRVMRRLIEEGIVERKWQDFAVSIQDTIQ